MLVTRVRNFYVGGTAFALSPEKRRITVFILIGWRNFKKFVLHRVQDKHYVAATPVCILVPKSKKTL